MNNKIDSHHGLGQKSARFQRRIQRYGWDASAEFYQACWQQNLQQAHQAMFAMAELTSGDRVFEIACGNGFVTLTAASIVGDNGHITATDISAEMIQLLKASIQKYNINNITSRRVAAEDTGELTDGNFDAALCALGLMYMPEPELGIRAMWQSLKPGGRAVATVWGARKNCAWAELFPIVDREVESDVCPLFFASGTGNRLADQLLDEGLESVQTRRIQTMLYFQNESSLFHAFIDGGPVALAVKRFDLETRQRVESVFLNSVSQYRSGDGFSIPSEYVVVSGVKSE